MAIIIPIQEAGVSLDWVSRGALYSATIEITLPSGYVMSGDGVCFGGTRNAGFMGMTVFNGSIGTIQVLNYINNNQPYEVCSVFSMGKIAN